MTRRKPLPDPIRFCIRNEFSQYLECYDLPRPQGRQIQSCRWTDHASHAMLFVLRSDAETYLAEQRASRFGFVCACVVQAGEDFQPLTARIATNLANFLQVVRSA